ncbi:hypothetical protein E3N88_17983 [Mikania micrantha]|uniref:Uncharacterized protein n=1 Tax=Mikania micrantha TaxID=192012 RepID=A0A5N6NWG3_9ASTR|nr:hypothetical protein E3N88_17983 [Mikania micrantha]
MNQYKNNVKTGCLVEVFYPFVQHLFKTGYKPLLLSSSRLKQFLVYINTSNHQGPWLGAELHNHGRPRPSVGRMTLFGRMAKGWPTPFDRQPPSTTTPFEPPPFASSSSFDNHSLIRTPTLE